MRSFLLVLVTLSLRAQSLPILCEPAPETLHLLEAVPPVRDTTIPYEQRVGELRRLAQKYPRDFFIQRTYEDSFRQDRSLGEEYDRALAMYRGRPEDPLSRYYEARLLAWSMPQRAREALNEMLADNPKFVWPHLDLAQYAALPGMRADADLTAHMSAFFNACPDAFIQGMSTPSRAALERRNSPLEAAAWPALWESEQKGKPDPDILARGVRADLKPIEAWPLRSDPDLYRVYSEAARILKDPDILKRFRAKVEAEAPHSLLALRFVQDDWENTNPVPDRNAPPIAWKQRQDKEILAYREWLRRWPNAWQLLVRAVMDLGAKADSGSGAVTPADLEIIDQALRVREQSPDGGALYPPLETSVARIYTSGRVRPDRVPALLDAGLRRIEIMTRYEISPDLFPAEMRARPNDWRTITAERTEEIRVDYLLATNRAADAMPLIEQALAKANPSGSPDAAYRRTQWIERLARVNPDAAERYRKAADSRLAAAEPEFTQALPEFSATDLAGRTWQLRDLKGKVTFVNFWATWCGPCRGEHAGIQELYERTKDRTDVQVLTFSVDDDAAIARQYMKEKGYTFPVIWAKELADRLFPYVGLPTNFLINPKGVRTGLRGFSPDSTSVGRLIEELNKLVTP